MMKSTREILEESTIIVINETLKHGFTQLPRFVLRDKRLSFGARLTYAVLLSYAWQEGSCFPGQERMANDLGVSRKAINAYLNELRNLKYISWERRGLGKTNVYYILDYKPIRIEADVTSRLQQDVTAANHSDVLQDSRKYIQ